MKLNFKSFLSAGFFAFAVASLVPVGAEEPAGGKFLVRDGVFFGEIFVADDCSMDELVAAQDLAYWIGKVCGIENLGVRLESFASTENPSGIFVGKTQAAQRKGICPEAFGPEAFAVSSMENALFLVGANPMATRHAAAKLLTKYLGVEFVFPGDEGAEWEPKKQVKFPVEDEVYTRAWTWRNIGVNGVENADWAARLGFGVRPVISHNLYTIFTPEIYEKHPQLAPKSFGKVNARRRGGYAPQANLANPLAVKIARDAAEKYFEENEEAPMFSVGINDCLSWDESAESARAYGNAPMRWFRNLPNRSDYFWRFADRVAKSLAGTAFPEKKISAIAYLDCQDAPTFPLSENIFPVLCADRSQWVFPQFAEEDKALMRRWGKSGVEAWGIYDYYYGNPFLFPRIFFKAQAESLRYAYANGARLFYAEIFPQVPFDAPKIWILSRLLENPDADPDAELKRFCELAYGKAAKPMYAFFSLCEKNWAEQGGQCRWIKGWRNENSTHIFRVGENCEEWLERARACFPNAPTDARERRIVARLDLTRIYLERAKKFAESFRAREKLELCSQNLDSAENLAAVLQSTAWNFEKIYDDTAWLEAFPDAGFEPCKMRESDPRATAFVRLTDALRERPRSPERLAAEKQLTEILNRKLPKNDGEMLRKLVPALSGAPIFSEDFEAIKILEHETGETDLKSCFVGINSDGWRAGKIIAGPASLRLMTAPAENLFCGETDRTVFGNAALKISGACETTELSRRLAVKPGMRLAASVQARGKISVGATAGLALVWKDARGNVVGEREFVRLACGKTADWERFIVAGAAPENAAYGEICLGAGLFAPYDYVCFDELEIFEF